MMTRWPAAALVRSGPVQADLALLGRNDIGGEALAVVHVVDVDALIEVEAGSQDQVRTDGHGALVIDLGSGDGRPVQFGLQKGT
jgi:hypothetical protein